MNTNSNLTPLCLNFAVDAHETYKSFSQWQTLYYFPWEITVEITTICHLQKVHCHYCRKDLPVHIKSAFTMPQYKDRRGTTPNRTLNFLAFVGLSQSLNVFEDSFFLVCEYL